MAKTTPRTKAWDAFSLYVRVRDAIRTMGGKTTTVYLKSGDSKEVLVCRCITCDSIFPITRLQGGHFIPGRNNAVLFQEKGVHAQCGQCNIYLKGNTLAYRKKIIEMYGDGYDEILAEEGRQTIQYKEFQYKEIELKYKKKTEELLKSLTLQS